MLGFCSLGGGSQARQLVREGVLGYQMAESEA